MSRRRVLVDVKENFCEGIRWPGFRQEIILPETLSEYETLWHDIQGYAERGEADAWRALMRLWSAGDHYFRLMYVSMAGRDAWSKSRHEPHFWHPVHIEIARWWQFADQNEEYLVASRGLGKSTHADNDDIGAKLLDPNHASCTFSHTREFASKHVLTKKEEMESNELLRSLWPDRFWTDPTRDAPTWALKEGLTIKRSSSRMEPSFSAHAFVHKLPVGMHFDRRYYDDIEEESAVRTDESIQQVKDQYISSQDLSSSARERAITGTYYHPNGLMRQLETEFGMTPRVYPCEDLSEDVPEDEAGPFGGKPVNGFTREDLFEIIRDKGGTGSGRARRSYGFQNLCDPLIGEPMKFLVGMIGTYKDDPKELARRCFLYACIDPSTGKQDPTWAWMWGCHPNGKMYWLDSWRKKLSPGLRSAEIFMWLLKWQQISGGRVREVRMEDYGQAGATDTQIAYNRGHNLRIPITKCADPTQNKMDRAFERWDDPIRQGMLMFPEEMRREDEFGDVLDLVEYFKARELGEFPRPRTDDGLDAGGLAWDRKAGPVEWPRIESTVRLFTAEETGNQFMAGGIL